MGNKEVYEFPVNAWFDISEGDGKIQRDVIAGATQPMGMSKRVCLCVRISASDYNRLDLFGCVCV